MATEDDLRYGDEIAIPWGLDEVHGVVEEIYGPPLRRHVLVRLTPEVSGYVVAESTSVSLPIEDVRKVAPAA